MQKKDAGKVKDSTIEELFAAGAHYGYGKSRRHPSASPYIYATKGGADIINLEKTMLLLEKAREFARGLGARGKTILFVGTKPEAKEAVKKAALSQQLPYVVARWIGGTFSNFSEIKKKITELEDYHEANVKGGLEKFTKKERLVMAKRMEKLEIYYTGLLGLKKLPDAIFVIDPRAEHIAATEAKKSGVPIIALANSDSDIRDIDYPIPGNDASVPAIELVTEMIAKAYEAGKAAPENLRAKETQNKDAS